MKNITSAIRKNRERLGLTQEEAAEKLGISQSLFNKWESGQKIPTLTQAHQLALVFHLDDELLDILVEMIEYQIQKETLNLQQFSELDILALREKVVIRIEKYIKRRKQELTSSTNR